ncbi:hypothetical protein DdX_12325 [Ditylenchus destructor]|uniref:Uncharacterized protein n=1 Tax=Ditylenchus destructor TaxID=166010 RepID=A0AAD4MXI4_9BILA|nr:hypothetical protein DdX_12325 [Ditylenchus destructor]
MSSYRIVGCPQFESSHVCRHGHSSALTSTLSSSTLNSSAAISNNAAFITAHITPLLQSHSSSTLGDYSLPDDIKHFCNTRLSARNYARPYTVGEYPVSRYHVQYPSHTFFEHFTMYF